MLSPQPVSRGIESRVVLLEDDEQVSVEVFEFPSPVEVGTEFECRGKVWRITANRPRTRVLLAQLMNQTYLG